MDATQQEQFTRLWTQAQPSIAGYLAAVVPDRTEADDLCQEVAVVLLRKFADYDPDRPFIAWAMGIAKMAVLGRRRDQARAAARLEPGAVEAVAQAWLEMAPEEEERLRALRACVERTDGRARQLLELRYQRELPIEEIAAALGLAAGTARVALHRLRSALQQCIERRLGAAP